MQKPVSNLRLLALGLCALAMASTSLTAKAAIVWDYSPATTGASVSSSAYDNTHNSQHFAERITFSTSTQITAMDIYTRIDPESGSLINPSVGTIAIISIWSEALGVPGSLYDKFTDPISVIDAEGAQAGGSRLHVDFSTPITLSADTPYWIGMSSDVQYGLGLVALEPFGGPGDWRMAQFNGGDTFSFMTQLIGDMAFRLEGVPVPEPSSFILLSACTVGLWIAARRHGSK